MAKEALAQNNQLFRALIERIPDAILLITSDGILRYANTTVAEITGISPEQLPGMDSRVLLHPEDYPRIRMQLTNFCAHGTSNLPLKCRMRSKNGDWRLMGGTALNLLNDPQVKAIMCTLHELPAPKSPTFEEGKEHTGSSGAPLRHGTGISWETSQFYDAERKFRSLAESNVIGVMVTDPEGNIYEINTYLAQLLGYNQEELLNGNIHMKDLLVPAYLPARARAWKTLISHGSSLPEEKEYRRKDGSVFPALVTAATINQERNRALLMFLDNSGRKDADRRKEEFMSMVGHELKTPLTIIQGFLELALFYVERLSAISSTEASDFLKNLEGMLQQVQQQAELETRLVTDLVDASRMEMQRFEVSLRLHNLVEIVQQVAANQQQLMPQRHIELILPDEPSVPVEVDADRIDQVLTNYLTNAFKYTPADQPVRVELAIEGYMARVSVRDRGPGLTAEEQQRIWDRFYQTESAAQQGSEKGLGLGLYIVRTIIGQHQGQVGVESSAGQGATFWFMLPLADEFTEP